MLYEIWDELKAYKNFQIYNTGQADLKVHLDWVIPDPKKDKIYIFKQLPDGARDEKIERHLAIGKEYIKGIASRDYSIEKFTVRRVA